MEPKKSRSLAKKPSKVPFTATVVGAFTGGVAATVIAQYADAISKVHGAACKLLPVVGVSVGWLNCALPDSEVIAKIDKNVEVVGQTANRIEDRTVVIDNKVDQIRIGSNPAMIARQKIANAGYTLDNAGYIKAIAQGSDAAEFYKDLRITGDEATLRSVLLSSKVGTKEYQQLAGFIAGVHSEHYAAKLRGELVALLKEPQKTKSANGLRKLACAKGDNNADSSFTDQFVRANLGPSCADEMNWTSSVIEFGKATTLYLQMTETYMWWGVQANQELTYQPTAAAVAATASSAVPVAAPQFIAMMQRGQKPKSEFIKVDMTMALLDNGGYAGMDVYDPATGFPGALVVVDKEKHQKLPCWIVMPNSYDIDVQNKARKPKCTARVTLRFNPASGYSVVAVDNVRAVSGDAGRPATVPAPKR